MQEPCLFLADVKCVMATDITPRLRWLASQTTRQPTDRKQPTTYHTPRVHSFVSIATATVCITVVTEGRRVWRYLDYGTSGRQSNVRSRCGVVYLHFRHAAMCRHAETRRLGQSQEDSSHQMDPPWQSAGETPIWGFIDQQTGTVEKLHFTAFLLKAETFDTLSKQPLTFNMTSGGKWQSTFTQALYMLA